MHPPPPRRRPLRLDRGRRRGRHPQGGHAVGRVGRGRRLRPRPPGRHRRHAGQGHRGAHRLRDPGRRARPRAAGRHADRPSTGCWPPGSASPRSTPSTTATSGRWWRCGAATSCGSRSARALGRAQARRPQGLRGGRGLLRRRPRRPCRHGGRAGGAGRTGPRLAQSSTAAMAAAITSRKMIVPMVVDSFCLRAALACWAARSLGGRMPGGR